MRLAIGIAALGILALSQGGCGSSSAQSEVIVTFNTSITDTLEQTQLNGEFAVFAARTPAAGYEPWVTDGTPEGTMMLRDIRPGAADGIVSFSAADPTFVVFNGEAFFVATDGVNGEEVWRTNGTPAGTRMLADLAPGAASLFAPRFAVVDNRLVIFQHAIGGTVTMHVLEVGP